MTYKLKWCKFQLPWQSDICDGIWCRNPEVDSDECFYFIAGVENCPNYVEDEE